MILILAFLFKRKSQVHESPMIDGRDSESLTEFSWHLTVAVFTQFDL